MKRVFQRFDMPRVVYDLIRAYTRHHKIFVYKCNSEEEVARYGNEKQLDFGLLEDKDRTSDERNPRRFYIVACGIYYEMLEEGGDRPVGFHVYYTEVLRDIYYKHVFDRAQTLIESTKEKNAYNY